MFKSFPIQLLFAIVFLVGCNEPQAVHVRPVRSKQINIPVDKSFGLYGPNGVWEGYKYQIRRENSLQLEHLVTSTDTLHLRYWNDRGQTVDIWSKDMKSFQGTVTNYADTFEEDWNYTRPFRTFYLKNAIDTAAARVVYNCISGISAVPSDAFIKDWAHGLDGINFSFEVSTPGKYTLTSYWGPAVQNEQVKEAKQILFAINNIDSLLDLKGKFAGLYDTLQPGHYSICSSYLCALHKFSKKEIQDMHLYEDEVRASMLSRQHFKADYK